MENQQAVHSAGTVQRERVGLATRLSKILDAPFHFYLQDDRKNFLLIVVMSALITAFLYAFKTESDYHYTEGLEWLHAIITFVVLCFNILLLPRIFPRWMDPVNWTVKKYIWLNLLHLALIGVIAVTIEKQFFLPPHVSWGQASVHAGVQVVLKGIIPISLLTLFLKTRVLHENLREAIKTNRELQKIQSLKKELARGSNHITLYSDTSESLTFNLPDLLYIEADDNYSTVVWNESGQVQKRLLRVNLKSLEPQLDNSFTMRCHRSYIVNINAIAAISGNTNGYKLKINPTLSS